MCGIAGYISKNTSLHAAEIDGMLDALAKRGPDGNGKWEDENVCLAHARLSIIDLEHSSQPLANEDDTIWITFNGEIYNYIELREDLINKGHLFKTTGDTEVLVHLYEEYGENLTSKLDGMFAMVIYNKVTKKLFAARDKVGIKPFYYWVNNTTGEFVFASSMESILRNKNIDRKLNFKALGQYLHFGYTVPPTSFIESVYQLKPGEQLTWEDGNITTKTYFNWEYTPDYSKNKNEWREELAKTLSHSVTSQLVTSDVPVGSFLSGGIDSTAVSGLAQQLLNKDNKSLNTFTVSIWDKDLDESERARQIANDLKTNHHELAASQIPFNNETLQTIIKGWGEPFGDTSSLNVLLLTKEVTKEITVALSGDGGDEIFFGYSGFKKQQVSRKMRSKVPFFVRKAIELLTNNKQSNLLRRLNKYCKLSYLSGPELLIEWAKRWHDADSSLIFTPDLKQKMYGSSKNKFPDVAATIAKTNTNHFFEEYINFHMKIDLSADCLYKVDRMSMENSLEVRVPLLSDSMIDLSMKMPFKYRANTEKSKELLTDIASKMAPTLLTPSPKKGFSFPMHSWIKDDIENIWNEWSLTELLGEYGFNKDGLKQLFNNYNTAIKENNTFQQNYLCARLFDLLILGIWLKTYKIKA